MDDYDASDYIEVSNRFGLQKRHWFVGNLKADKPEGARWCLRCGQHITHAIHFTTEENRDARGNKPANNPKIACSNIK